MGTKKKGVLIGGRKPVVRRRSRRDWTPRKRERFVLELAATCNVTASARSVKMGVAGVYQLRMRDAEFRAQWAAALREGYAKLEMMLVQRALIGTVKTITRSDGRIDKIHEYPNHLAFQLLKLHRTTAAEAESAQSGESPDEVDARLARKLEALRLRIESGE